MVEHGLHWLKSTRRVSARLVWSSLSLCRFFQLSSGRPASGLCQLPTCKSLQRQICKSKSSVLITEMTSTWDRIATFFVSCKAIWTSAPKSQLTYCGRNPRRLPVCCAAWWTTQQWAWHFTEFTTLCKRSEASIFWWATWFCCYRRSPTWLVSPFSIFTYCDSAIFRVLTWCSQDGMLVS